MGFYIILQLNGGSFLEFLLLSETAAPRTIEFFRVLHQNNTSNFQPFHFTSSHLHVGTTFDVLFFPVQVLTVFLSPLTETISTPPWLPDFL